MPSNFEENALSGFEEFEFGQNEQICSTEAWNMEDIVSTARRDFRTNQQDDHQSRRNYPQTQQIKFPTFLAKRGKLPNNKPQKDKEDLAISELVMRYTSNSYNSFNKI